MQFASRFSPMYDEPFWPQTVQELEDALKMLGPPSEEHDLLALNEGWRPSSAGLVAWFFSISHAGGRCVAALTEFPRRRIHARLGPKARLCG
jgi:hypothetical protein